LKEYSLKDSRIYSGSDCLDGLLGNLISGGYSKVFVLADTHTAKYCLPILNKHLMDVQVIRIEPGEASKDLKTAQHVWNELQKYGADRKSLLINVGGGVVCDMGGFCAATFKRGIRFIHVPTTLMAMVDASIGGKVAVDFNGIKNMLGVFRHPHEIYVNPGFLDTLPADELLQGFAEIIKHALVADEDYWEELQAADPANLTTIRGLINRSVKIKVKIVKKDPLEKSKRKLLNFGHTIGHALESWSLAHDSKPLRHGEAVAAGMICEAWLSHERTGLPTTELTAITSFIRSHFKKYPLRNVLSPELIRLMKHDKKNEAGHINFTLLKRCGKGSVNHHCDENQVMRALQYYEQL
jgi:3-dehydroquinate synthase